jgi:hypothetical protein
MGKQSALDCRRSADQRAVRADPTWEVYQLHERLPRWRERRHEGAGAARLEEAKEARRTQELSFVGEAQLVKTGVTFDTHASVDRPRTGDVPAGSRITPKKRRSVLPIANPVGRPVAISGFDAGSSREGVPANSVDLMGRSVEETLGPAGIRHTSIDGVCGKFLRSRSRALR